MNNYAKLIKAHMISFKEVMVLNYKEIGLNEVEAMIIILLYEEKKHKNQAISVKSITKYVTLNENELSKILVSLVEREFIELTITNNVETFILTPTIDKLGKILAFKDEYNNEIKKEVANIVTLIESNFQKTIANNELLIIQNWVNDKISFEDITKAVHDTMRMNKNSVKYVDGILKKRYRKMDDVDIDPEIQAILKQIHVK